jgi:fucose permease
MAKFLRTASPEKYLAFSAAIGILLAWLASRIPGLGMNFLTLAAILLSIDVITYIAMKAGWIRTPKQRSGIEP